MNDDKIQKVVTMNDDELHSVYCDRVGKSVPITVSKRDGVISLCCCYEEGERDCQHRAEPGCALYERFSGKGNPVVGDLSVVLGERADGVRDASKALIDGGIPFVIGGRDAVNAYCPGVIEETLRTDFFIRSLDRDAAWKALAGAGFKPKPLDPTCCVATKGAVGVELHYGRPPEKLEYVNERTLARAIRVKLMDMNVALQPLEELIAYKADRYTDRDSSDLARLLGEWAGKIDIGYLREVARERALSLEKLEITEQEVRLKSYDSGQNN